MAFVLKKIPDVRVDVTVQVPGEEKPSVAVARWRLHAFDDFKAKADAMSRGEIGDEQLVDDDLLGLEGIKDEDGKDLPFSAELAHQLMQITAFRRSLIASWFNAQQGGAEAAAKN